MHMLKIKMKVIKIKLSFNMLFFLFYVAWFGTKMKLKNDKDRKYVFDSFMQLPAFLS
jgi:hypothetical protein